MFRITLIKYISKEIWAIFLTCLVVLILIIMAARMLNMTEMMVNYGAGFFDLLKLILCEMPRFILLAMPAASLMAVLLSFIRMASDNELIALHSSGISLYQLLPPVIIFSLFCFLFAGVLTMFWVPYGNRTFDSVKNTIKETSAEAIIKERVFIDTKDFVFFVNSFSPKDKIMNNIFMVDKRKGKESTIVAKKARFIADENTIQIMDYKAFFEDNDGELRIAEFQVSNKYKIPVQMDSILEISESGKIEPDSMYIKELSELIDNSEETRTKNIAKIKLYEMFSLPVAILLIGMAGAPLGAHIRAHGRTKGIIISFILFLSYYIILTSIEYLCENGIIDPAVGTWLPTFFLLIMCVFLLSRSSGS
ncbi:MAG: LptF/LptG family permease [Deltaproteobacteria bacterium]|nr:LptF/LptG family permease [Deltaproteobacteria bacterium]